MKERPILFNDSMVRAILDGQKTQTRRIVKPQPTPGQGMVNAAYCGHPHLWLRNGPCRSDDPTYEWKCPYGKPGDRLWVRETWKPRIVHSCFDMACDCETVWVDYPAGGEGKRFYGEEIAEEWSMPQAAIKGRPVPSLHMPRWASRILMEIASVRVERLNDICEDDAVAEGVDGSMCAAAVTTAPTRHRCLPSEIHGFSALWERINGHGSWATNPWVWVIDFRRIKP